MKTVLNNISLPGKTILVERFNDNDMSLADALAKADKTTFQNQTFNEAVEALTVRSFDEFLEKFQPCIYQEAVQDEEHGFYYRYTTTKNANSTPIAVDKQEFYKAIERLYNRKANANTSNIEMDYGLLSDLLSPAEQSKKIARLTARLTSNQKALDDAKARGASPDEIEEYNEINLNGRADLLDIYKDNAIALLPLAIQNCNEQLKALGIEEGSPEAQQQSNLITGKDIKFLQSDDGTIQLDMQGAESSSEQYVKTTNEDGETEFVLQEDNDPVLLQIKSDYDNYAPDNIKGFSPFRNALVASVSQKSLPVIKDKEQRNQLVAGIKAQKDVFVQIYTNTQQNFVQTASDVIEKILSVKALFDHAEEAGVHSEVSILVTNCRADELVQGSAKDDLTRYLDSLSTKTQSRLWFAVIPGIGMADKTRSVKEETNPLRQKQKANAVPFVGTDLSEASALMKVFAEQQIITFFSYKGSEKTGFLGTTAESVSGYKDKLSRIDENTRKNAVFCYPNFTVLPENKRSIKIGEKDGVPIYISGRGLYIDSCYVACGLYLALQNPEILKKRLGRTEKVKPDFPCVRVDMERYSEQFVTKMNCESIRGWTSDIRKEVNGFGLCFCCDELADKSGNLFQNAYVISARTLEKINGAYAPLFRQLTANLFQVYVWVNKIRIGESISNFTDEVKNKWTRNPDDDSLNYANCLLAENEKVDFKDNVFTIGFNGGSALVDFDVEAGTNSND